MAKEPRERFGSYDEFIMALTAARSQLLIRQFAPQAEVASDAPAAGGSKSWWRR
jgi:hypothetical protein